MPEANRPLKLSSHALERFRAETTNPTHAGLTDQQIARRINEWWAIGKVQEAGVHFDWAEKFQRHGIDHDVEHRLVNSWIITRKGNEIVTVHFKTRTERRRDRRHR